MNKSFQLGTSINAEEIFDFTEGLSRSQKKLIADVM